MLTEHFYQPWLTMGAAWEAHLAIVLYGPPLITGIKQLAALHRWGQSPKRTHVANLRSHQPTGLRRWSRDHETKQNMWEPFSQGSFNINETQIYKTVCLIAPANSLSPLLVHSFFFHFDDKVLAFKSARIIGYGFGSRRNGTSRQSQGQMETEFRFCLFLFSTFIGDKILSPRKTFN